MILQRLEARDFGKYRRLVLDHLPGRGLLGILGPNESGKTTIGEAVSFALFGRAPSGRKPEEYVRWGADELSVSLDFRDPDGVSWRVTREVDRSGTYAATLRRSDGTGDEVRGVGKVLARVNKVLHLGFEEFVYAFYLGQKELDQARHAAGESRRRVVDELTGVSAIERAVDRVSDDLERLLAQRGTLEDEVRLDRRLLEELGPRRPAEAGDPEAALAEAASRDQAAAAEVARLEAAMAASEAGATRLDRAAHYLQALRATASAHHLAARRRWLQALEASLLARLTELDANLLAASRSGERRERFRAKVEELKRLVAMRADQVRRAMENHLPGDVPPGHEDELSPEGKLEQLVVTRLRARRAVEAADEVSAQRRNLGYGALAAGVLTLGCWLGRAYFASPGPFFACACATVILLGSALWFRGRVRAAVDRVKRLQEASERLDGDVSNLREALRLAEEFDPSRLAGLGDRLARMGGGALTDLYAELERDYKDFLEGSDRYLRDQQGVDRVRELGSEVRQDLAEVRYVAQDLESWLQRFGQSPFFRVPGGGPPVSGVVYERQEFRAAAKALTRDLEGCQKLLFSLDAEVRSKVSPRLCSSFKDFEDALEALARDAGKPHRLELDALRPLAKEDGGDLPDDPVELVRRQEQRLAACCPPREQLLADVERLRSELQAAREEAGRQSIARAAAEQRRATAEPDAARLRELAQGLAAHEASLATVLRELAVREVLLDLLQGLAERMRQRLGPALADYLRLVLPRLTEGRYRDVRLTEGLELEVWSPERSGFVGLGSLSGGTADQLLVALRLAFSKALMDTTMPPEGDQFLFFDEPLSSFDAARGGAFLSLLRSFGGTFAQVLVVTHLQELTPLFDARLECLLGQDVLEVDLGPTPVA